jgi:hypothetical protein
VRFEQGALNYYGQWERTMKMNMKLMLVFLAVVFPQITLSNAQSASPAGHYSKKLNGAGEMWVQETKEGWRVIVSAGGVPNGGATAADCTLIAVGAISASTFQGEIKYQPDTLDDEPGPDNAVEPGRKLTITFVPRSASLTYAEVDGLCGIGAGVFGRYIKE